MNKRTRKSIQCDIASGMKAIDLLSKWGEPTLREYANELDNIARAMRGRRMILASKNRSPKSDWQKRVKLCLKI